MLSSSVISTTKPDQQPFPVKPEHVKTELPIEPVVPQFSYQVMSSSKFFETSSEYFEEILKFSNKYQHLYNFPNTDLLIENVLDRILVGDLENIEPFATNFDLRAIANDYLKQYFEALDKLTPNFDNFEQDANLKFVADVPLSVKKRHEISYLAKEVGILCNEVGCDTVVDFGSGLGYLDQQIFETTNLNLLGLECNEQRYVSAKKRQRKYHMNSIERVKYIKHLITQESTVNITEYLKDKFPDTNGFCIAGLHACADLTVDAMNIFLKMHDARALIIMPCCYHRLQIEFHTFKNFPLSQQLKDLFAKHHGAKYLTVPFLRLATQPQINIGDRLEDLVFNLLSRAVLQLYGWKHNCKLKRRKRKAIRVKELNNDFEKYIQEVSNGFSLIDATNDTTEKQFYEKPSKNFDKEELLLIWRQINRLTFKKSAIFILLQNYMQPVFENFVLYDRIVYLRENNIKCCKFKRIIDGNVSPRCLSLIAYK